MISELLGRILMASRRGVALPIVGFMLVGGLVLVTEAAVAADPDHGCEFPTVEQSYNTSKAEVIVIVHLADCFPDAADFSISGSMFRDAVGEIEHDSVDKRCNMTRDRCRARLKLDHDPVEKADYYGYLTYVGHLKNGSHQSGAVEFHMKCLSTLLVADCSGLLP